MTVERELLRLIVEGYDKAYVCNADCENTHWGSSHFGTFTPLRDAVARARMLLNEESHDPY